MLAASATKRSPSFFPLTHGREVMCRESSLGMVFNEVVYGCVNSSVFAVFFVSLIFRILDDEHSETFCELILLAVYGSIPNNTFVYTTLR